MLLAATSMLKDYTFKPSLLQGHWLFVAWFVFMVIVAARKPKKETFSLDHHWALAPKEPCYVFSSCRPS